jgi:hypothetical protein
MLLIRMPYRPSSHDSASATSIALRQPGWRGGELQLERGFEVVVAELEESVRP